MRKRDLLITFSVISSGIALGGFLGYFVGGILNPPRGEAMEYIEPKLDDINQTLKTYKETLGDKDVYDVDLTNYKSTLTPSDIANIVLYNQNAQEKFFTCSYGIVEASAGFKVTQYIFAGHTKNNNSYLIESSSIGLVNTAIRLYANDINQESTNFYQAFDVKGGNDSIDYKFNSTPTKENLDNKKTVASYGRTLNTPCIFVISNDSVKSSGSSDFYDYDGKLIETFSTSFSLKEDNTYSIKLLLDPQKSCAQYAIQMGSMAQQEANPDFYEMAIELICDRNLMPISKRTIEQYTCYPTQKLGSPTESWSTSYEFYKFGDKANDIVEYNEKYDYTMLKENNII